MIRDALSLTTMAAGWFAIWCATPGDAMASELTPWNQQALSSAWGAYALVAVFVFALGAALVGRMMTTREPSQDLYDDPKSYGDYPNIDTWEQRK